MKCGMTDNALLHFTFQFMLCSLRLHYIYLTTVVTFQAQILPIINHMTRIQNAIGLFWYFKNILLAVWLRTKFHFAYVYIDKCVVVPLHPVTQKTAANKECFERKICSINTGRGGATWRVKLREVYCPWLNKNVLEILRWWRSSLCYMLNYCLRRSLSRPFGARVLGDGGGPTV